MAEADNQIGHLGTTPHDHDDTIMPHMMYTESELRKLYPPLEVPEAVDAQDPQSDFGDALVEAGNREIQDIIAASEAQGRKKRIRRSE